MRTLLAILVLTAVACDRGGEAPETDPTVVVAPTSTEATTTTEPEGCDDDLVDQVLELLQDQLDALSGLSVADVVAGAADTPAFRDRESRIAAGLEDGGCRPAALRALVAMGVDDLDADGAAAERYLALVGESIRGAADEP